MYWCYNNLNDIVKEININELDSEMQCVEKIINYISSNYNYAYEYDNDDSASDIYNKFYKYGYMYGILNENEELCGNYASLFAFIANNLGIDCLVLIGERHALNMVTIDNDKYFIDCLDESITKIGIIDRYNKIINLPEYITDLEEYDFNKIKLIMAFLSVTEILALIDIAHKRKKYDYLFEDEEIKEYVKRK